MSGLKKFFVDLPPAQQVILVVAVITVVGSIITGYFDILATRGPTEVIIEATRSAEALENANLAIVSATSTPSLSPTETPAVETLAPNSTLPAPISGPVSTGTIVPTSTHTSTPIPSIMISVEEAITPSKQLHECVQGDQVNVALNPDIEYTFIVANGRDLRWESTIGGIVNSSDPKSQLGEAVDYRFPAGTQPDIIMIYRGNERICRVNLSRLEPSTRSS